MKLQHSIMVGILDRYADRFTEFQPAKPLETRMAQASTIPGADGVELVYPADLADRDRAAALVQESGLAVSAVNLNVKSDAVWRNGSFTNPDEEIRRQAVDWLTTAMDLAADFGSHLVTVCPLMDGWDYSFQVDYVNQWRWLVDGFRRAMDHRDDVRVSIEYKAYESRTQITVPDVGTTLHLCDRVGSDNLGVTMDVGHALIAGETPAMSAAMAHDAGRLFYVHFNDNNRGWDWDIVPGAVHIWEMVETLFYLDRIGWEGWLAYDVFTKHGDPVQAFDATIRAMEALERLVDKIGRDRLQDLIDNATPAEATAQLITALVD
ncbi:sugar phosphate isomerase/epimerase family protein [Phytoactinopolyspora endophytica]|uniref:sugar phosphate isomerase/epimerase family protein n=1 Tax=Phytoactinopolyspora endophytica TaxID=1642495 RepID=UPI00101CB768|nr:sugar phosphate isomerase/epimerase family protein [Phytoactinopolyspora endophytica]